jgi:hypothetical protein
MDEIPEWVRIACRRWGRQKRRIWSGGDWYRDHQGAKRQHVDGYASSFLGRLLEERDGTGQGARGQRWSEVLWGDALDVQRAIVGMSVTSYDVVHLHYVFDPEFGLTASAKAALLNISVRTYWTAVKIAEVWLWAKLDRTTDDASRSLELEPNKCVHKLQKDFPE